MPLLYMFGDKPFLWQGMVKQTSLSLCEAFSPDEEVLECEDKDVMTCLTP